jgi:two-component system, OmpR family, copper resistance phosphate regulon response regulator CusR
MIINILIIEDEPKVAAFIKMGLEENDYTAQIAYDGAIGKSYALTNQFDLIILDINLPQINGFELCKIIRNNNIQVPVLMLTALDRMEDKLQGFDHGADDYLAKPFDFKELLARIRALLKRSHQMPLISGVMKVADLEINRDAKTISRKGKVIELSSKEFSLLEYLAVNSQKVISRAELIKHVWGENYDANSNVVDVYINFLRNKIDKGHDVPLIHTRVGLGYTLKY